ncbi:MAG TPA: A/G-specific adenine glycosylase [Chthoniobacterales bacterium]
MSRKGGRHADTLDKAAFRRNLIDWFKREGRDLPWRRTRDPYAILVSEFMLQQTQVATVLPYYERWLKRFPTLAALAAADEQTVLSHWQGLGYYTRARNLHRLARGIREFPRGLAEWERLPGIGPYTAAAVAAFAFDDPAPVVDGNIARVLARLLDYRDPIDTTAGKQFLKEAATALQPASRGGAYNSALMELGALICRPAPDCLICPVRKFCQATDPAALPVKQRKMKIEPRVEHRAFVADERRVWLQPAEGRQLRGFWLLPEIPAPAEEPVATIRYTITRFPTRMHLHLKPAWPETTPFALDELAELPIPTPHRRAIAAARDFVHSRSSS